MSDPRLPDPTRRGPFLERETYRRARLEDAARLLPVLGLFLVISPIAVLTTNSGIGGGTGGWLLYFFAIWAGLIALAWALGRALTRQPPVPPEG